MQHPRECNALICYYLSDNLLTNPFSFFHLYSVKSWLQKTREVKGERDGHNTYGHWSYNGKLRGCDLQSHPLGPGHTVNAELEHREMTC